MSQIDNKKVRILNKELIDIEEHNTLLFCLIRLATYIYKIL